MIEIVKFKPEHADLIQPREAYRGDPGLKERLKDPMGYIYTIMVGEEVGAIVGGVVWWPGMAEIWSVTSDVVNKAPIRFHKKCLAMLNYYESKLELKRIQATVRLDFQVGHRWIRSLGFEAEGLMRQFGPDGSDYVLYARVKCQQ